MKKEDTTEKLNAATATRVYLINRETIALGTPAGTVYLSVKEAQQLAAHLSWAACTLVINEELDLGKDMAADGALWAPCRNTIG